MESWHFLNPDGRLKRRPYFYRFVFLVLFAIFGGYLLRKTLVFNNEISPYYLELTFLWGIIILGFLTPLAVQRCRDIGISIWWVVIFWFSPLSNIKLSLLISKYTGATLSEMAIWATSYIASIVVVFAAILFFSRSVNNANHTNQP
jgi:uncharacterized membrane protein YhaH (DUF805 family)